MPNNQHFGKKHDDQWLDNLRELSAVISQEGSHMQADLLDLAADLSRRVARLWYGYFSKGIPLSTGGVENSLITMRDLRNNPNLKTFNIYRSDRGSVFINPEDIKKFLVEENVISPSTNVHELAASFCLGSHEGVMRIARCIYQPGNNDGVFFSTSCYGLLATAFSTMQPLPYKVYLVDIHRDQGEKISLTHLKELARQHPSAKTLFLELKTMAGAIYTTEELKNIILFCKEQNLFLIADTTHINMSFNKKTVFPDVSSLSQQLDYHEFAIIYTTSKTYGLERARVGFILTSKSLKSSSPTRIEIDMYRVIGASFDLPFEIADKLLHYPLQERQQYLAYCAQKLRFNMNLMLAYIESVESKNIDEDLRELIKNGIPPAYRSGIPGITLIYKPQAGMHMKIDISGLKNKYLSNIKMFNSEIFCYALNKMQGVVTLHSYCILDPKGFSLRLSYSIKEDIHRGMQAMNDFVAALSDCACENQFLPGTIEQASDLVSATHSKPTITLQSRL